MKTKILKTFLLLLHVVLLILLLPSCNETHTEIEFDSNASDYQHNPVDTIQSEDSNIIVDDSSLGQNEDITENQNNSISSITQQKKNIIGNLAGNLQSNAYIAEQGDYIYFCNSNGSRLFSSKKDGTMLRTIFSTENDENCISQISVYGDHIYFCIHHNSDDSLNGLYRIDLDGTDFEQIISTVTRDYQIYNEWIYYQAYESSGEKVCIYKCKTNGSANIKVLDSQKRISSMCINSDQLYWINDKTIYKSDLNGKNINQISNISVTHIQVIDNWIYYRYESFSDNISMIGRINSDGNNNSTLIAGPYLSIYTTFIATKDYLYFENGSQRIDLNNLEIEDLFSREECYFEDEIQCFNIGTDYIFYSIAYGKSNATILRIKISHDNPLKKVESLITNTGEWDLYSKERFELSFNAYY